MTSSQLSSRHQKRHLLGLLTLLMLGYGCAHPSAPTLQPTSPSQICRPENTVYADVVAIEQVYMWNRFGAFNPGGMMFALRHDVVSTSSESDATQLKPGAIQLRPTKRPRPLVLRVNEGQCLEVLFENLLSSPPPPNEVERRVPEYQVVATGSQSNSPKFTTEERSFSADLPRTRSASMHVNGLDYVAVDQHYKDACAAAGATACGSDGAFVGTNTSTLVAPGHKALYRWYARKEGAYFFYSMGAPVGGEGNGGQIGLGLFGAVNVEPAGSMWYRSQVTRDELEKAAQTNPGGHPYAKLNYSRFAILDSSNHIRHSDLNAIVAMPHDPAFKTHPGQSTSGGENTTDCATRPNSGSCGRSFREFTAIFHDEIQAIQAFPELADDEQPISSLKDGMAINYGAAGLGAMLGAAKRGLKPLDKCVECRVEEFFLTSWANGDPALLLTRNPETGLATGTAYPDDPSNVHHSYMGDPIRFRNIHAGPKETHVFHLHAHQWLQDDRDPNGTYLDSQTIAPGSTFSYAIEWGGSGNRNMLVGDSIFHCHLYPHFAQGMWELWRSHDVFEDGTAGVYDKTTRPRGRALPDGELAEGTLSPALVPIPGRSLARLADTTFGGYPFYIPGQPGHRPPQAPYDIDVVKTADGQDLEVNGGLPRHRVLSGVLTSDSGPEFEHVLKDEALHKGGEIAETNAKRVLSQNGNLQLVNLARKWKQIDIEVLPAKGTPDERIAIDFHAGAFGNAADRVDLPVNEYGWKGVGYKAEIAHAVGSSIEVKNITGYFPVNSLSPKAGAPFADPCPAETANLTREYRALYVQGDLVVNKYGWHDPQARILLLEGDLKNTVKEPHSLNGHRQVEPLFIRANSGECVVYKATNLIPNALNVDDFQVYTPTDTIGQHIHLVKFDVTASDGSANGWNYEDGTFSPDEIRERIAACNNNPQCLARVCATPDACIGGRMRPRTHPLFRTPDKAVPGITQQGLDNKIRALGLCKDFGGEDDDGIGHPWCGAQTTVQRWWADPLVNFPFKDKRSFDRTIRTVFTHDHMGPSSHQHHGFYAALVVEPKNSVWEFVDGRPMGGADLTQVAEPKNKLWSTGKESPPGLICQNKTKPDKFETANGGACKAGFELRADGGPTSYAANIIAPILHDDPASNPRKTGSNEDMLADRHRKAEQETRDLAQSTGQDFKDLWQARNGKPNTRREYNLAVADFALVYTQDLQPINSLARDESDVFNGEHVPFRKPVPEGISAEDPGTQLINYRNEPVPLRIGRRSGDDDARSSSKSLEDACGIRAEELSQKRGNEGDLVNIFSSRIHSECGKRLTQLRPSPRLHPFLKSLKIQPNPVLDRIAKSLERWRLQFITNISKTEPWRKPGDPSTPLLATYEGDPLQIRLIQGAQEEQHVFTMHGIKWLAMPAARQSGFRNAQHVGISEHFEFSTDIDFLNRAPQTDYLYASSATDNLWDGMWGLLRSFPQKNVRHDLKRLLGKSLMPPPQSVPGPDPDPVCPLGDDVPKQPAFNVTTWAACDLLGNCNGPVPGLLYNARLGLSDPYAVVFVRDDLEQAIRNRTRKVEPLILRVPAGVCVKVNLTNKLPGLKNSHPFNQDDPGSTARRSDSLSWNLLPAIADGFNFNQIRPSRMINLHPQLLTTAVYTQDSRVGLNAESRDDQGSYVPPGKGYQYRWYAGNQKIGANGKLAPAPIELGVAALDDMGDAITRPSHAGAGALVVEPKGACILEDEDSATSATVIYHKKGEEIPKAQCTKSFIAAAEHDPDKYEVFRDFVLVLQDSVHLTHNRQPLVNLKDADDSEDSGHKAFNYRSDPLWARAGHASPSLGFEDKQELDDYADIFTGARGPIEAPIFTARAGTKVRFRIVHPGGHPRQHSFTLHGHNWDPTPWKDDSTAIDDTKQTRLQGTTEAIGPARHLNLVTKAGGALSVPGDYLFRSQPSFMIDQGLWGIFRVCGKDDPSISCSTRIAGR